MVLVPRVNNRSLLGMISALGISCLGVSFVSADTVVPIPIFEYKFNETGTTAASTGSNTTFVTMQTQSVPNSGNTIPTDLHSAGGLGVSGAITDRAFDNTSATGMGNASGNNTTVGPVARTATGTISSLDGLKSFTMSGWLRASSVIDKGTNIIAYFDNTRGVYVSGDGAGRLYLTVRDGTDSVNAYTYGGYTKVDQWMFFAITFDGTQGTKNIKYYYGEQASAVALLASNASISGTEPHAITTSAQPLAIGNKSDGYAARPFDGYLDNIRIFGSATDASGALTKEQLEAVRQGDLVIPEPASTMIFGSGLLLLAASRERRR